MDSLEVDSSQVNEASECTQVQPSAMQPSTATSSSRQLLLLVYHTSTSTVHSTLSALFNKKTPVTLTQSKGIGTKRKSSYDLATDVKKSEKREGSGCDCNLC